MGKRGTKPRQKPDEEWAKAMLARLEGYAAHVRSLGLRCESSEARAAELREILSKRTSWRLDKPLEAWTLRQKGILAAETFDPTEARHLTLRVALGCIQVVRNATAAGAPVDQASNAYKLAVLTCEAAADAYGNPRSKRALWKILDTSRDLAVPEDCDRTAFTRESAGDLLALSMATGVSISTIVGIVARR